LRHLGEAVEILVVARQDVEHCRTPRPEQARSRRMLPQNFTPSLPANSLSGRRFCPWCGQPPGSADALDSEDRYIYSYRSMKRPEDLVPVFKALGDPTRV